MPPVRENTTSTQIALLERDIMTIAKLFDKSNTNFEKISEVSTSMQQLLAIHELKLQQSTEHTENIYHLLEKRHATALEYKEDFDDKFEGLKIFIDTGFATLKAGREAAFNTINERVNVLEKWKWRINGIAVAVGALFALAANFVIQYGSNLLAAVHSTK